MEYVNRIIEGDCLAILPKLKDHSIDMVLCDLPYAITQNKWDTAIDLEKLWTQYRRIIKPNGVIALTGQHRFTGLLISSNPSWFKYKIVWIKSKAGNFLNASKQPLRRHEDICIFYDRQPFYNPQKTEALPYDKGIRKDTKSG
jgi:site-specific DNA-methyltransferase (adenine-specific)